MPIKNSEGIAKRENFVSRVLKSTSIAAGTVILLLIFWYAVDVMLLVFAAVLVGVFLYGLSHPVSEHTGLDQKWSLLIVLLVLAVLIGLAGWLLAGRVVTQINQLANQLPIAFAEVTRRLEAYEWGNRLLSEMPSTWELFQGQGTVFGRMTGIFSGVLGTVLNIVIIIVLGCYLAAEPRIYSNGILHLVPLDHRDRTREVLGELSTTLSRWLVGRLILMVINGAITAIGLWLLGIPLALTLGLLAGVLNFIPNFGPLIAGVPAVLISLTVSPQTALYVVLLYIVVQSIDGYVFTPLVNRRSVQLPPVLTIFAQVLLGVLAGSMGVVLAGPLTAMLIVLVRTLYVEDMLGDRSTRS